jgi:glycosyltransferase involved in cell wall biosynthesis
VYNGAAFIEETIQSVLSQGYDNMEYIIVDGGSTDGTLELIKKYEDKITQWVSEPDTGIYNAMNKGWNMASGDVIGILNADDYYEEGALEKVAKLFTTTQADVVYGGMTKLRMIGTERFYKKVNPNLQLMERTMGIFHPATFVSRKVYEALNGYNEKYKLSSDYDFLLRAYLQQYNFQQLDDTLAVFRIGGISNTDCTSFVEGHQILLEHNSKYADQMKAAIKRCYFKRRYKQIINTLMSIFGLQKLRDQQLAKKWRQ